MNCDSRAAIPALDNTKIKPKTTLDALSNQVLIRWTQHISALRVINKLTLLPIEEPITLLRSCSSGRFRRLLGTWKEERGQNITYGINRETHFRPTLQGAWWNKFSKSIHNLHRGNLRKATMLLTGHVALNYYFNKYKISKTCPHCIAAEETTVQCQKWSAQRSAVLTHPISEVVDIFAIIR